MVDKICFIFVENIFNLNCCLYFDEDSICWIIRVISGVDYKGFSRNRIIVVWNFYIF